MSANILEIAKGALGGPVIDQLGGLLGENREGTQSALDSALPSILGGLMQTASTSEGAASLSRMADEADGGLLDNIGGLISNNSGMLTTLGGPLLGMIFGGKQSGLVSTIARLAGIRGGSVGTLLQIAAPLIMSMLGKKKKELSLNTDQFRTMLMDQKDHVTGAMHPDVSQSLGFGSFLNAQAEPSAEDVAPMHTHSGAGHTTSNAPAAHSNTDSAPAAHSNEGGGFLKRLLPLAVVAALGYIGYTQFFSGSSAPSATQIEATQTSITSLKDSVGSVTSSLSGITDLDSAKTAAESITAATGSLGDINFDDMGDAGKQQVTGMLGGLVAGVEKALETAYQIPGVQAVIEPAVGPYLEKLRGL